MRFAAYTLLAVAAIVSAAQAQTASLRRPVAADMEFRPAVASPGDMLQIVVPDIATGRSQRRPITDLMVRVSLAGGDVEGALRLPNNTPVARDSGLARAAVYVVSGGRLMAPAEARCDRWIEDLAVCTVACDGGTFALKRRAADGRITLSMLVGRLPRGTDEGDREGFALNPCDSANAVELILAPAGQRSLAEIPMRSR